MLESTIKNISHLNKNAMDTTRLRFDKIAKPLKGLGLLEEYIIKISGITSGTMPTLSKRGVVIMCSDNGVVQEGVTQAGQEVTGIVAKNMITGKTSLCNMAKPFNIDVIPVDVGMVCDVDGIINEKIAYGTNNIAMGPAMSKKEALKAIDVGIKLSCKLKSQGYNIICMGEMGIGNTTTSAAIASVLLNKGAEYVTGKGAGLDNIRLDKKISVIKKAIALNKPDKNDALDVLSKLGGFDIAALTGLVLGLASNKIPCVCDGVITLVAALLAKKMCPASLDYVLSSHVSLEPASPLIIKELGLTPILNCNMRLGEGCGGVSIIPILDMALNVYKNMITFEDMNIDEYKPLF